MNATAVADEVFDPFVLLHQSVMTRLQMLEAEVERTEQKAHELERSLEALKEHSEEIEVTEKHILNNLKHFSADEIQTVYHDIVDAQLKLERAQDQYEALVTRQAFQIIEEERMRIARDMHDGPAQSMANLVLQAEILERLLDRNPKQLVAELAEFKNSVRNALEETRQLIFDLRPMTLDDLGLIPTLRKYIKEYGDRYGLTTRFNVVGQERRLPGNTEGVLFRIIQEALTNVHKHARAKMAEVTMNLQPNRVSVTIKDDGQGFDVARTEANLHKNKNLGLLSMRERAELEKGTLEIRSQPGRGTEVKVEIRVDKKS